MYKISFFVLVIAMVCSAIPLEFEGGEQLEQGPRFRRVTCDLMSIELNGFSAGHAACAAHCLAMRKGFRGGRCIDGVCHCRK